MNRQEEPLVSVLTPVYNGAPFLAECIESVIAQSHTNWEYIIVNNASTDGTLQIAEEYAKKDKRIKVYSNDTLLPIIANHNRAFRLISPESKYCKVLSGDDWMYPECLAKMVELCEANPSVVILGSYQLSGYGNNWNDWHVKWAEIPYPVSVISGREVCRSRLLMGTYVFGTPTSLMYRSDIVRAEESFYPNATAEADTSSCFKHLSKGDFGYVHQVLSYERVHEKQMSEECRNLNAYKPSLLGDLMDYGPTYLTPEEMEWAKEENLGPYYKFLGESLIRFRGKDFWAYHKRRLRECRCPLSRTRLAGATVMAILDLVLNPKRTAEDVLRPMLRRRQA
jgi:glycosyltransferase involved in cell wall biosynthesis